MASSPHLLTLPTDVLHCIFMLLDDCSLLSLRKVNRHLRIFILAILLARYRSCLDPGRHVQLSSGVVHELQGNLMTITKLVCSVQPQHCEQLSIATSGTLRCIVASLPNLVEIDINLERRADPEDPEADCVPSLPMTVMLGLLLAFAGRKSPSPNILALDRVGMEISTQRRVVSCPKLFNRNSKHPIISTILSPVRIPLKGVTYGAALLYHFLRDPHKKKSQVSRVKHDLRMLLPCWGSLRLICVADWTFMFIDELDINRLPIGHRHHRVDWGVVLPHINIPALKKLHVMETSKIRLSHLLTFLPYHPTISCLTIDHCSIIRDVKGWPWPLPHLQELRAPLYYVQSILPQLDPSTISSLGIGRHSFRKNGRDHLEEPFNFAVLGRVLSVVARSNIFGLSLTLPGGSAARQWLLDASLHAIHEEGFSRIRFLGFSTESNEPFSADVLIFLRMWLVLKFPSLEAVLCSKACFGNTDFDGRYMHIVPDGVHQEIVTFDPFN